MNARESNPVRSQLMEILELLVRLAYDPLFSGDMGSRGMAGA